MSTSSMHFSANFLWYLRHPWKWFREFWFNLRDSYQRIKFGWSFSDVWNMDDWFLDIIPPMLRQLAEEDSYPAKFDMIEDWHDWLRAQADKLEKCKEDGIKNEFEEEFHSTAALARMRNTDNSVVFDATPEFIAIRDKYFARQQAIHEEQCRLLGETFEELGKYFYDLWS